MVDILGLVAANSSKWLALTAAPGTSNLRLYLHEATLPPLEYGSGFAALPVPDCKSHANHLNVQDEMWRRLRVMDRLILDVFNEDIGDCKYLSSYANCCSYCNLVVRALIPSTTVGRDWDPVLGEMLTVPCPSYFRVENKDMCYALDLEKLVTSSVRYRRRSLTLVFKL